MRVYATYGMNCKNDLSQRVYQVMLDDFGITDIFYQVMEVSPVALNGAIESLRMSDFAAANILWPYQEYITEIVDEQDDLSKKAFCANTVVGHDKFLSAYNTNGIGFMNAVKSVTDFDPNGKKVLLLGAGAIARTIAVVLSEAGTKEIIMANRTNDRAIDNAMDLAGRVGIPIKGCGWNNPQLSEHFTTADIIVNCTFLGDVTHPGEMPVPNLLQHFQENQVVVDVTIDPVSTPFLEKARAAKAKCVPGYLIYVHQCVATYKLWTQEDIEVEYIKNIVEKELGVK